MASFQPTEREAEVAALTVTGLANAEIADRLLISLPRVKTDVLRVLAKTGCGNRTQLAATLTQAIG